MSGNFANLTQLPLDDAMIWYAVTSESTVDTKEGWKFFKMVYNCPQTCDELFTKFWSEIIPNKNSYGVVKAYPPIVDLLDDIPNPNDSTPPYVPQLSSNFHIKSFWTQRKEEDQRDEKKVFQAATPKAEALQDYIARCRSTTGAENRGDRGDESSDQFEQSSLDELGASSLSASGEGSRTAHQTRRDRSPNQVHQSNAFRPSRLVTAGGSAAVHETRKNESSNEMHR